MIIISGRIYVHPGRREALPAASLSAIERARRAKGCRDFVVAADPVDDDRVNVYEEWETDADLEAFRGAGPDDELSAIIVSTDVSRHRIASSGPA